jgi:hypothetical protein
MDGWKHYSDKVQRSHENLTLTKVQRSHGKDEKFTLTKSSILMNRWKYNSDKWVVSTPDEVLIMIGGWMDVCCCNS